MRGIYGFLRLANRLANPFGHPSQVHTQVLVFQICVDLRRLASPFGQGVVVLLFCRRCRRRPLLCLSSLLKEGRLELRRRCCCSQHIGLYQLKVDVGKSYIRGAGVNGISAKIVAYTITKVKICLTEIRILQRNIFLPPDEAGAGKTTVSVLRANFFYAHCESSCHV